MGGDGQIRRDERHKEQMETTNVRWLGLFVFVCVCLYV